VVTWIDKVEARGEAKGRIGGRVELLLKLLLLKFGPLDDSVVGARARRLDRRPRPSRRTRPDAATLADVFV
jgi:hypothetical protein